MSALAGFRVLELSESVAGEYCGKLLADFGAEVIKLERPILGSPTRYLGPFAAAGNDPERSGLFAYLNTNKRSVALDVHSPGGRIALEQWLNQVDVVIDDHAPDWLRAIGVDPAGIATTYPALVLCSITPFGQDASMQRATDLTVFHASGWGYHTPSAADDSLPPLQGAGRFLPSYEAALDAAVCITAALYERHDTTLGRVIDISMQAVLASRADYVFGQMAAGDMDVGSARTALDLHGPAGIFPCRDGYVYLWMSAPAHWQALRELLGAPAWMDDFPGHWLERECTPARVGACRRYIGEWLATQDKHTAAAAAQQLGLTLVAVNNAQDLIDSPQYRFRHYFMQVEHPVQGTALYPTVPYRLSATPACIRTPAPLLGEHSQAVPARKPRAQIRPATAQAAPHAAHPAGAVMRTARGGPLQGVRVVELTKVWAGPYVGKLLAFLGAEVIRVESEGAIDVTRIYGVSDINNAPGFQAVNPQKLSVQIDMKTPQGVSLLLDLLRESDIVIENLRPGAVRRLGLDYEAVRAVKPEIVYVSMGMYGSAGPLSYQTGYAPCFAALGGLSALVGYAGAAPSGMNIRYADSTFGASATFGALVALLHRRRSGVGQLVDVSAVESMSSMIGDSLVDFALHGTAHYCDGNRHAQMAPHGVYACGNGEWISLAVASDAQWRALAALMGRPELAGDPAFASLAARKAHESELDALIAQWVAGESAAEREAALQAAGIAAARSRNSLDIVADPMLWSRGFYTQVTDRAQQTKTILGPAWIMDRPATLCDAAPQLGEHNDYVLGTILGRTRQEQQALMDAGVTR